MTINTQVSDLLSRYQRVVQTGNQNAAELVPGYNTLRLANAALNKSALAESAPEHPLQVVIVGPTQAGKSTLCNLITDANPAGISALAGYTVHAQGFAIGAQIASLEPLQALMKPLQKVSISELDHNDFNQYVLDTVEAGSAALIDNAVVWDSPDFDSIESQGYRGAVLQTIAMADVLIFMVSKDKYADKTVWDMLELVASLGKPLFVCINKLDAADEATVTDSFKKRFQDNFNTPLPQLVALPFIKNTSKHSNSDRDQTIAITDASRDSIKLALSNAIAQVDRENTSQLTHAFIREHWPSWIKPLKVELSAQEDWQSAVAAALEDAETRYVSRFLDNPNKYDTFDKAIAELLTLLEIPGIAGTLSTARSVVTWPARKLLGIGQKTFAREHVPADQEQEVLELILEQSLTTLQGHIIVEQQNSDDQTIWWQALQAQLLRDKNELSTRFSSTAAKVQSSFEPRIEATAQQLYSQLKEQPALLNSLRAARVTTDAAAVVMAVKSGGLAPADLVIAPAMLSVTTLLTESVLGQYMERAKKQLKEEQLTDVRKQLLHGVLGRTLHEMSIQLDSDNLLSAGTAMDLKLASYS